MNKITADTEFLIIGLGVIGGSYAEALSAKGYKVKAITKEQKDIDYALKRKMISEGTTEVDENIIKNADIIIFALYPHILTEWLEKNQRLIRSGTLITDVTGVKSAVVPKIQSFLRPDLEFIASHPMAGRESRGIEYADGNIFKAANFIVTPTEKNTREAIEICKRLGETLGFSRISELSIEEHDKMIGFLSQLTHCIAISLMTCNTNDDLVKYTGDSFRDLIRIAKINDEMWSELFLLNKKYLSGEIDMFINELEKIKKYLDTDDRESLREMMKLSTRRKIQFDKHR